MSHTRSVTRLEAFSDGVFAIAITLLVLELKLPEGDDVWGSLAHEWPSLMAFTLSFVTILVMWINHHGSIALLHDADTAVLFANGMLLLAVTFVPFPTAVLGQHLRATDPRGAAAFYALTYVILNVLWFGFWQTIVRRRGKCAPALTEHEIRQGNIALGIGFVSYCTAFGLAFWKAWVSVTVCLLLAVFWSYQAVRRQRAAT